MSSQLLKISGNALIAPAQNQIASKLPNEAILLNLNSGTYYGLNEVGTYIWGLIAQRPYRFDQLRNSLLEEYDVSPQVCEQDLTAILLELKSASLVEVSDGTAP